MLPCTIERESGDFFLGRAVQHESFAGRRDAVDQAAAVGTGNQVALSVEREHADVRVVAFEK